MTYVVPKSVVVNMGTVDADTLCGLPCSYYLDYNNLNNVPAYAGLPDFTAAAQGDLLVINSLGLPEWQTLSIDLDGGAASTVFTSAQNFNGGGA